jgi:hypothetical protein
MELGLYTKLNENLILTPDISDYKLTGLRTVEYILRTLHKKCH